MYKGVSFLELYADTEEGSAREASLSTAFRGGLAGNPGKRRKLQYLLWHR